MTAYILYNRNSPAQRLAEGLADRLSDAQVDSLLLDADSPRGIQMVDSYDILDRPAVVLMREDGSPLQIWQGEDSMPSVGDVSYLAHQ